MPIETNPNTSGVPGLSGVSQAQLDAVVATIPQNRFINTVAMPIADIVLLTGAQYEGKYALSTDLYGSGGYLVREGGFWKPVRPLAVNTVANANANMTVTSLLMAPTQILKGTLTAGRDLVLSTEYAYPGSRFRIKKEAGGALISTLIKVGTTLLGTQLTNTWADYEFDGTTWVQTASGGLL